MFAQKNGLKIVNKDGIAKISSKILDGKTITVAIEEGHWDGVGIVPEQIEIVDLDSEIEKDIVIKTENEMDKAELILQPKEYIIGIGCKRGKEEDKLIRWIQKSLEEAGIFMEQVYALASIDRKKDEEGLLRISQRERIPFYTYSAEELERVTGNLHESEFVKKTVGVSNVCERAALYACGDGGRLVYEKHAEDGMTIAKTAKELEKETDLQLVPVTKEKPLIAVARDEAFCFYYAENLSMLEQLGAELVFFSPLHDCELPKDCHGLLLGGGYPELVAEALSRNQSMLVSIRQAIEKGMPSVAECGGFMYLHGSITDEVGMKMPMAGVIPATCYNNGKLVRFGYIELEDKQGYFMTKGNKIRAHEFHYYDSTNNGEACMATKPVTGKQYPCIMAGKKFWWGFPHLYYPSNPTFARHFVEEVVAYKKKTEKR